MLEWKKLLLSSRRKDSAEGRKQNARAALGPNGRAEIERDYDRILFSAPVRRLADKTQVFPLDQNDSIRTRLTHSHEVSALARSLGIRLAYDSAIFKTIAKDSGSEKFIYRAVPSILAAIGLVHDLGNPPFGHQGEESIKKWFEERNSDNHVHKDFLSFDGNAQTFRLLTRLQILNDKFGLNLTYATLAASIKYPAFWNTDKEIYNGKKFGVFESEREIANEVWRYTGLKEGVRHPLTFIMEACDDIAYSVLDAEDTIKKGYASFYDLMDFLSCNDEEKEGVHAVISDVISKSKSKNEEYKDTKLSSKEVNDISMQMFRVYATTAMIEAVYKIFVSEQGNIMNVKSVESLIEISDASLLCKKLKDFDFKHGYKHKDVLKLELEGSNYILSLMDMLWVGISSEGSGGKFEAYAYSRISENYRRIYEGTDKTFYFKYQLLCDAISGMTDSYLISLHNELRPLFNGYRSKQRSL